MDLQQELTRRYLRHLVATPQGRAHVLAQCADAESSGEGQVFERALARVDDPDLQRMIRRHQADEERHSKLFWEAWARQGLGAGAGEGDDATRPQVPAHLRLIDRLDRALGGILDQPITDRVDVMRMYLILQVIEERAITQFALFEPAFRAVDPRSADVFAAVARDEERHLKYCHAIARRYAPDERTQDEALRLYREVEARAFADNARANMEWVLARNLADLRPIERLLWTGLARFGRRRGAAVRTTFWGTPASRASVDTHALAHAA